MAKLRMKSIKKRKESQYLQLRIVIKKEGNHRKQNVRAIFQNNVANIRNVFSEHTIIINSKAAKVQS